MTVVAYVPDDPVVTESGSTVSGAKPAVETFVEGVDGKNEPCEPEQDARAMQSASIPQAEAG